MASNGDGRDKGQKRVPPVPAAANCFVAATAAVGAVLLIACWARRIVLHPDDVFRNPVGLLLAVAAAILCGSRSIRISKVATISVGAVIVFVTLVHVGLAEACIVAAISGLAGPLLSSERHRRPAAVIVFAPASIVVTAGAAGVVFRLTGAPATPVQLSELLFPAILAAVTYHVVNCALVAGVASLASERPFGGLFLGHLVATPLAFYAGAGWAVLVHLALVLSGVWVLLAALPLLYCLHVAVVRRALGSSPAASET